MASFTVSTFTATGQSLTLNETGLVTRDGEIATTTGDAISVTSGSATYLSIHGSVLANDPNGLNDANAIDHAGSELHVFVGADGSLNALNADTILARPTDRFYLSNLGTIQSGETAVNYINPVGGLSAEIVNHGIIDARETAILAEDINQPILVTNSGVIHSATGTALQVNSSGTGGALLRNSGTITGSHSFQGGAGGDFIYNTGVMMGAVFMSGGNDRYEGRLGEVTIGVFGEAGEDTLSGGALSDQLYGGTDNDTLVGRGGDDFLDGGTGNDVVLGGDGNDEMLGGVGDDTLNGNAGDDTIEGDIGNDVLVGQDGSDYLDGGTGNDTLDGGAGNDVLEGGDDNDVLRGRDGEDVLAGGLGLDFLTGGADADIFVFRTTAQAGIGATRDQILDFEQGVDQINVVSMAPGVFEFKGTGAFAPSGNPELRLIETATGSTIVQFDVDGDGTADAEIRVANVTGLTADDFAL